MATQNAVNNIGTGVAPTALCNYNGTTQTIRGQSANISSVTYSGVGQYIFNFSPSYADANYIPVLTTDPSSSVAGTHTDQTAYIDSNAAVPTTMTLNVCTYGRDVFFTYDYYDNTYFEVAIFGN